MRGLKIGILIGYTAVAAMVFGFWIATYNAPTAETPEAKRLVYERIEGRLLRRKLKLLLKTPAPDPRVAIVSLGWRAEKVYGPPPWPRDIYAAVIAKLRSAGAKAIVLDPLFADAQLRHLAPAAFSKAFPALPLDQISVVNPFNYVGELKSRLDKAEARLKARLKRVPDGQTPPLPSEAMAAAKLKAFQQQRDALLSLVRGIASGDASRAFEREVAKRRDIVFPSDYSNKPRFAASKKAAVAAFSKQAALKPFAGQQSITAYKRVLTLYPRLLATKPLLGINELDRSQPRFISFTRALVRVGDRVYPSSVVRGLSRLLDAPIEVERNSAGFVLTIGALKAQLDADGSFPLAHYNAEAFPPRYSAIQLLRGKLPKGALRDKLVLLDIRTKHTAAYLQLPTPLEQRAWASSIKATLASNLLAGHRGPTVAAEDPLWLRIAEALAIWLLGGLFVLLALRTTLAKALLGGAAVLAAVLVTDWLLLTPARSWLALALLGGEIVVLLVATIASHYLIQRLQRRKLRRAFGFYLPAPVLQHVLADEDALRLGGTRRNLSILFSDIRGFTTLSERADPEALGEALNEHLTALTQAVFDSGGTLDKYMGDCVMAFFGAPVKQPDHPAQAVRAALEMQRALREIQPMWREKCGQEVGIGVGVATGDVIVGNMGSRELFDYSVVGDQVNLASRLEGLTKIYGVEVLVSEETMRASREQIAYLEVDIVRVKGKQEPVSIYEAIGEGEPSPERKLYDVDCQRGIEAFRAKRWDAALRAFEEAARRRPEAKLPELYRERIEALREGELPADWDGVTEFTHK
jgi:adenylate cyclase